MPNSWGSARDKIDELKSRMYSQDLMIHLFIFRQLLQLIGMHNHE